MQKIYHQDHLLGMIVREEEFLTGYNFVSPQDWLLQIGFNNYQGGFNCQPHEHLQRPANVMAEASKNVIEVLHVLKGRCLLQLYWQDKPVEAVELKTGDSAVLVAGGHGIKMLEPTKIFEVKQGPYVSRDLDKRCFNE
ncbi:hypothetical protein K2X30_03920 [bacterium]|jgi:hypothetical protein|nr:hypothetical protein [bacterium]